MQNRNYWTLTADDVLIESLEELYKEGTWQPHGDSKEGYLARLQTMMKSKLPDSLMKGSQEILSRINSFKRKYYAINEMINEGCFEWNDEQMMVVGDKSYYKDYFKFNKKAKGLFREPFLHYYSLKELLEKDVTTAANVGHAKYSKEITKQEDVNPNLGVNMQSLKDSIAAMGLKIDAMAVKVDGLVNAMSNTREEADLQAKLVVELEKLQHLDKRQVFQATNILAPNHDLLRVFFTMPREMKRSYIINLVSYGL